MNFSKPILVMNNFSYLKQILKHALNLGDNLNKIQFKRIKNSIKTVWDYLGHKQNRQSFSSIESAVSLLQNKLINVVSVIKQLIGINNFVSIPNIRIFNIEGLFVFKCWYESYIKLVFECLSKISKLISLWGWCT